MSIPVIAFFNNKGGVGKTSLVYHLAWMYADQHRRVLVADLDPQANLTAAFLEDDRLEELWPEKQHPLTIFGAVEPLLTGTGDVVDSPHVEAVSSGLGLIPGDLALAQFEDELSQQWPRCLDGQERAFRVLSAFWRVLQRAATEHQAEFVLIDLGPNLGAINRAALVASDFLAIPLVPDLFSLQGLKNLGPMIRKWRRDWGARLTHNPNPTLELPRAEISPVGYIVMQHAERLSRPVRAYERWANRIPESYNREVLGETGPSSGEHLLARVKHYRSLMPMAQEARKPMFHLTSADGAIGAHTYAVAEARENFSQLASKLLLRCNIPGRSANASLTGDPSGR
jgi:chromosome partitioning protein